MVSQVCSGQPLRGSKQTAPHAWSLCTDIWWCVTVEMELRKIISLGISLSLQWGPAYAAGKEGRGLKGEPCITKLPDPSSFAFCM